MYALLIYSIYLVPWLLFYFPLPLEFRAGKAPILIATDVASRGLGKFSVDY